MALPTKLKCLAIDRFSPWGFCR